MNLRVRFSDPVERGFDGTECIFEDCSEVAIRDGHVFLTRGSGGPRKAAEVITAVRGAAFYAVAGDYGRPALDFRTMTFEAQ